jgi:23S rRNA pseudouridine1911/1915/1917 synthase
MATDGAQHVRLDAGEADAGGRLDQFIAAHLTDVSRSQAQRLIREGRVTLSGGRPKASLIVTPGLSVDVVIPAPVAAAPLPEPLALTRLYDDDDLLVVVKPAGMVVHPGAGHRSGTLVNALLHAVPDLSGVGGAERPGIVHRLDRGTSTKSMKSNPSWERRYSRMKRSMGPPMHRVRGAVRARRSPGQ